MWYVDWYCWNWQSRDLFCYGNHFGRKLWILSYQHVCIYKLAWHNINTIARVFNHILLEREDYQHSDKVCGVCIISLGVELWVKMCNTCEMLCKYYHILVDIFLNIAAIQIPHTLWECWWPVLSNPLASVLMLRQNSL